MIGTHLERNSAFESCSKVCFCLEMARAHDAHLRKPVYRAGVKVSVSAHLLFLYLGLNQAPRGFCRAETKMKKVRFSRCHPKDAMKHARSSDRPCRAYAYIDKAR